MPINPNTGLYDLPYNWMLDAASGAPERALRADRLQKQDDDIRDELRRMNGAKLDRTGPIVTQGDVTAGYDRQLVIPAPSMGDVVFGSHQGFGASHQTRNVNVVNNVAKYQVAGQNAFLHEITGTGITSLRWASGAGKIAGDAITWIEVYRIDDSGVYIGGTKLPSTADVTAAIASAVGGISAGLSSTQVNALIASALGAYSPTDATARAAADTAQTTANGRMLADGSNAVGRLARYTPTVTDAFAITETGDYLVTPTTANIPVPVYGLLRVSGLNATNRILELIAHTQYGNYPVYIAEMNNGTWLPTGWRAGYSTRQATQAEALAGTAQHVAMDPLRVREAIDARVPALLGSGGAVKAWGSFNGATMAIGASSGCASITRQQVIDPESGVYIYDYLVTFAAPLADANYAAVVTRGDAGTVSVLSNQAAQTHSFTAGSFKFRTGNMQPTRLSFIVTR